MRSLNVMLALSAGVWIVFAITNARSVAGSEGGRKMTLLDDCDPRIGAGWNTPTDSSQCIREEGSVSRAEFTMFLTSPLTIPPGAFVIGHPAWRIAPTYLKPEPDERLTVRNGGGRGHTFTEVANYGGGFIPVLNIGMTPAPECAAATGAVIAPGGRIEITGLALGNHKFQCCIHPWMRALVKVEPED